MAAPSGSAPLETLETAILGTIETIDRLSDFIEPSMQPNNAGLALNLCAPTRPSANPPAHPSCARRVCSACSRVRARAPVVSQFLASKELVSRMDAVRTASADVDVALPVELVQQYVDAGKSPDGYTAELHGRAARLGATVQAKQRGFRAVEEAIRHVGSDLLRDDAAKREPG